MTESEYELYQSRNKPPAILIPEPKKSKYRNIPTIVNGITFDSRKEAKQYEKLLLRQGSGQIRDLQRQVPFPIVINGVEVCTYIADFTYYESDRLVVGDAKGYRTEVFRLKAKLVAAVHGISIRET